MFLFHKRTWVDHRTWSEERKKSFADLAQSSQDALINSFFWTWKIGESIKQDHPPNPMWNYKLGLEAGYIRPDARASSGRCSQLAAQLQAPLPAYEWAGTLSTWQTGGLGAGNINQAQLDAVGPFPPLTILGGPPNGLGKYEAAALPQLAPIGPVLTLKPTPIVMGSKNYPAGDGWYNPADVAGYFVPINGCQYLDPWSGFNVPAPTLCNIPAPPAQTPIANPAPAAVVNGQASMPTPAPTRPLR